MHKSGAAIAIDRLVWEDELLAELALPRGPLRVTRGVGSGLARRLGDPPGQFWAIGDRGPNLKIKDAVALHGLAGLRPLLGVDGAKVMPCLELGPALVRLRIEGDVVSRLGVLPLRGGDGRPLSGLPPPAGPHEETEPIFTLDGAPLGTDPSGIDSEAVVARADGGFWIADEYGPSLIRVDRDGIAEIRWVPDGTEHLFEGSACPVAPVLPPITAARRLNRGFEALALSPDERWLYALFQSPLAHPDRAAHERSRHVRLWQIDAASGSVAAEYLYPLDPPESFRRDLALGPVASSDIKVSEALMLGEHRLLLLERVTASTKFHRVTLDPGRAVPPAFRDPEIRPTIEQMDERALTAAGIVPLAKTCVFDTDDAPQICGDLEGMLLLAPDTLLLVNDNDFGVAGIGTEFWRVRLGEALL